MIPDEVDSDPHIDFTWFYFIGATKLGLSYREVGRITITLFNKLYSHYKNVFDLEARIHYARTTYADVEKKANAAEEWF